MLTTNTAGHVGWLVSPLTALGWPRAALRPRVAGHCWVSILHLVAAGVLTLARCTAGALSGRRHAGSGALGWGNGCHSGMAAEGVVAGAARRRATFAPDSGRLEVVNFNDPMQTVIAGSRQLSRRLAHCSKPRLLNVPCLFPCRLLSIRP